MGCGCGCGCSQEGKKPSKTNLIAFIVFMLVVIGAIFWKFVIQNKPATDQGVQIQEETEVQTETQSL